MCIIYRRYRWNTVISELNKNDNFTSEITIFIFTLAIFLAISLSTSYEDFQFET